MIAKTDADEMELSTSEVREGKGEGEGEGEGGGWEVGEGGEVVRQGVNRSRGVAAPLVRLTRVLGGQGLHRTLAHRVEVEERHCRPRRWTSLYLTPPSIYVDLNELRALSTTSLHPSVTAYADIDVKRPAHLSAQHAVQVVQMAGAYGEEAQVSIHLRYQQARPGGGEVQVELGPLIGVWVECEGAGDVLVKVQVEYGEGGARLVATVPVGDLDDAGLVIWSAVGLSVVSALVLIAVMAWYATADGTATPKVKEKKD